MDILFRGTFKSLNDFEWKNIPQLAVLTGLNGSGKTQLLELIHYAYQNLSYVAANPSSYHHQTEHTYKQQNYELTIENVDFRKTGVLSWKSQGGNFAFEEYDFRFNDLEQIIGMITKALNPTSVQVIHEPVRALQNKAVSEESAPDYYKRGIARTKQIINHKMPQILEALEKRTGKPGQDILPQDILLHLPEDIIFEDQDIISQDFLDMIFFLYIYKKASLENNNKDSSTLGLPPWEVLNQVISTAGLPYHFTSPNEEPIKALFRDPLNRDSAYKFSVWLVDKNEQFIGIPGLSSGERIILSLAMLLYYFQHRQVRKNIIILDEVDAFLHPSLTRQFFDVVNQNIIEAVRPAGRPSFLPEP